MPNFNPLENKPSSTDYTLLLILTGLALATYTFAKYAKKHHQLRFEHPSAQKIANLLAFMVHMLHSGSHSLELPSESLLVTGGPHRTGSLDAIKLAMDIKGLAPRFFATDMFKKIPGVAAFMNMFQVILVEAEPNKGEEKKSADSESIEVKATPSQVKKSANSKSIEEASKILQAKGCVAIFPQGNLARLGQKSPKIYRGAAQLAFDNRLPLYVIRLDGFWCLQNPLIPVCIRNHVIFRTLLCMLHLNNIRTTLCCVIDFHTKHENYHLSEKEVIEEICAQLYAYYCHTEDLTPEQIKKITTNISKNMHHTLWKNKCKQEILRKELLELEKEETSLNQLTENKPQEVEIGMNRHSR